MNKNWKYLIASVFFYILMLASGASIFGLVVLTLIPIGETMPMWGACLAVTAATGFAFLVSSKTRKVGMGLLVSALVSALVIGSIVSTDQVAASTIMGCLYILLCFLVFGGCKDGFVYFRNKIGE